MVRPAAATGSMTAGSFSPRPGEPERAVPHRVLYVDDEPALLEVCRRYFKARTRDIEITCATSARQALDLHRAAPFEVIISDYHMPGMTGIDLLKHLQSQPETTPFILFTCDNSEEVIMEAINNGATYYLCKGGNAGLELAGLEHRVREAIRRQDAIRALILSEMRYRAAFENSGTALLIIDDTLRISLCNNEFERITGYSCDEVQGRMDILDFIQGDDINKVCYLSGQEKAVALASKRECAIRIVDKKGASLRVNLRSRTIPGTRKKVVSLTDISERERLREELQKREDEIRLLYSSFIADSRATGRMAQPFFGPDGDSACTVPEETAASLEPRPG